MAVGRDGCATTSSCEVVSRKGTPETLPALQRRLVAMEREYFALLPSDPRAALQKVREMLSLLDEHLPIYPTDLTLQLLRAYAHKNAAMAQRDSGDDEEFHRELETARRLFDVILREAEANLAGAYNGIGSVTLLQGQLDESLRSIDKALALVPEYGAAQHDRGLVLQLMAAQKRKRSRNAPRTLRRV